MITTTARNAYGAMCLAASRGDWWSAGSLARALRVFTENNKPPYWLNAERLANAAAVERWAARRAKEGAGAAK